MEWDEDNKQTQKERIKIHMPKVKEWEEDFLHMTPPPSPLKTRAWNKGLVDNPWIYTQQKERV